MDESAVTEVSAENEEVEGRTTTTSSDSECISEDLRNAILVGHDLTDGTYVRANMVGSHLHGATVTRCDFTGALLAHASLERLTGASPVFVHTNAVGAEFDGSTLHAADFSYSNLANATFTGSRLEQARFIGCSMPNAGMRRTEAVRGNFHLAQLVAVDMRAGSFFGANFSKADFSNADLREADFSNANLRGANFTSCKLQQAMFVGADLTDAVFVDADLSSAVLIGATAVGVDFEDAHSLQGADFSGATVTEDGFPGHLRSATNTSGLRILLTDLDSEDVVYETGIVEGDGLMHDVDSASGRVEAIDTKVTEKTYIETGLRSNSTPERLFLWRQSREFDELFRPAASRAKEGASLTYRLRHPGSFAGIATRVLLTSAALLLLGLAIELYVRLTDLSGAASAPLRVIETLLVGLAIIGSAVIGVRYSAAKKAFADRIRLQKATAVNTALHDAGKDLSLNGLFTLNRRQLDEYHNLSIKQQHTSFRAAQAASGVAFAILVAGIVLVLVNQGDVPAQNLTGGLAGLGSLLSSFVAATFYTSYRATTKQLREYYWEPFRTSRLIGLERLIDRASKGSKGPEKVALWRGILKYVYSEPLSDRSLLMKSDEDIDGAKEGADGEQDVTPKT